MKNPSQYHIQKRKDGRYVVTVMFKGQRQTIYLERLICSVIVNKILNKKNYNVYNPLIKQIYGRASCVGLKKDLNNLSKKIHNLLKIIETCPTDEATERLFLLTTQKNDIQKKIDSKKSSPEINKDNLKELKKELYKELRKSSDPVIYDILDNTIEKITVSNDCVDIDLKV